ncbi:hypothetical protein PIB30_087723 [Stylosanthes scabra]|uniref:Uncharacterized protein n=1 Tax=Stylosanthes scabra TaxID=79078 RepID=A0ABU6ZS53_9FABA|nr:hypothetical protein [Stylosanthes scabra]
MWMLPHGAAPSADILLPLPTFRRGADPSRRRRLQLVLCDDRTSSNLTRQPVVPRHRQHKATADLSFLSLRSPSASTKTDQGQIPYSVLRHHSSVVIIRHHSIVVTAVRSQRLQSSTTESSFWFTTLEISQISSALFGQSGRRQILNLLVSVSDQVERRSFCSGRDTSVASSGPLLLRRCAPLLLRYYGVLLVPLPSTELVLCLPSPYASGLLLAAGLPFAVALPSLLFCHLPCCSAVRKR